MLSAKLVYWNFKYIDNLLKIKELFPNSAPRLIYSFDNMFKKSIAKNEGTEWNGDLDLTELAFSDISIIHKLLPEEFDFVVKLLRSNKTKFRVWNIGLAFNLLSDCLLALSLCAECPEIETINFQYRESDVENGQKTISSAVKEFRKKMGFIQNFELRKIH